MARRAASQRGASTRRPGPLVRARALAMNLWWTWSPAARRVLESMDPGLWVATNHNPLAVLDSLSDERRRELRGDVAFSEALDEAERSLAEYLEVPTWFERTQARARRGTNIAYFCMEYALHESMALYAGGLGVLAGDHLKSASDLGLPLCAVGILWRKGYYRQEISADGEVRVHYPASDFSRMCVRDTRKSVSVPIGRTKVRAKIWQAQVGRVSLYLLDTDVPQNKRSADRTLTHHLYKAGEEIRVRQEVLLGIGGLMALDKLGIRPSVFHLNEGHAAFCGVERVRRLVREGEEIDDAIHSVRGSTVFTTHTPVPEGNDRFEGRLVLRYLGAHQQDLGLTRKEFLAMGREDPEDTDEPFCMTVLALKLAEHCNGVAALHGDTARRMWMKTFDASEPDEVPIGHVTNGIHVETWLADEARPFYARHLKAKWVGAGPDNDWWARIKNVDAEELWSLRQTMRRRMVAEVRARLRRQVIANDPGGGVDEIVDLFETFDDDALTIGFARRFALYKRAPLIFKDWHRLARIVADPDRPVQIIFAGKAHPADAAGHEYVARVRSYTRKAPFKGRILILENYDMGIGRLLTSGCDVWLNNPLRPMEASGTSGMKPVLHGGLNCSILDGWWPEGFNGRNGWAIGDGQTLKSRAKQDSADAQAIYELLEQEIVPSFYERDASGVPRAWVRRMRESMRSLPCRFSSHRMVGEYWDRYYRPASGQG